MEISNILAEIENEQKLLSKKIKNLVNPLVKTLFNSVPELKAVQWVQFVPYFNDGDACVFSVHQPSFFIDPKIVNSYRDEVDWTEPNSILEFGDSEYNSFDAPWYYSFKGTDKFDKYADRSEIAEYETIVEVLGQERLQEIQKILKEFTTATSILEEGFRKAYGEHSMVTLVREGNEINTMIDDYDHD